MINESKKIVIVGAGMAGLTAASYLTAHDYEVLLIDKNDRTGGLVNTFGSQGFFFDGGPRAFVNSGIVKPILKELGIQWEFLENKISIGVEDELFRINSMDSLREYEKILTRLYPEKTGDVEKIISITNKLSEHTKVLYEFDNPNFVDLLSDKKFIFKKLLPWTVKFLIALQKFKQFNVPMEEFYKQQTDSQSLIDIMTQFFFRNTPTYFALGYFYVYLDYFYPMNGTSALPNLLKEKILMSGGKIKLNTKIKEVNPSSLCVVDSEGVKYDYDHLIWASDLKTLYRSINTEGLDQKTTQKINLEAQRILAAKGAESVFILFVGVDLSTSFFQVRGGEHLFYTPSRQGLGDTNRGGKERILRNIDQKPKEEVLAWLDDFCNLNTFEVSIPALRDPALAPEGKTGLMISCLFDYEVFKGIEKAGWYDEFKKTLENRIIEVFSRTIYPGLKDAILFKFSSTPLTIHEISGSSEGAITGWSFAKDIPVINKLTDIPKSALTPIPGVYQAGQWAYAPAGVPIAMLTGWHATQEIIKKSKRNK